ncbi:MAG: hypothetical protein M1817_001558 [Caeruleum heppii]|nr:MAG: hypothetical protein M1817_001558 [Caeruleum heppii]
MRTPLVIALLLCVLSPLVVAWGKEDHEIFRLRDEVEAAEGVGVSFYDFVGISQSATQEEIKKAYHKKSRLIHPDKVKQAFVASKAQTKPKAKSGGKAKPGVRVAKRPSQAEINQAAKEANERFTRLGIVTEILRGSGRERYDHFLKNGFPRWRGTGYYYARFRPGLVSVLLGLFIVGGGGVHYAILYLSWKRQREFVDRYIRHARRAAWGDESAIAGIPGINEAGTTLSSTAAEQNDGGMMGLNRRQRRMQEKESRKGKGTKDNVTEVAPAASGPRGSRKKVVAENGKVLIVDSTGSVFLEEEDEDGEAREYLLDADEILKPNFRQTVLFRMPAWIYGRITGRLRPVDTEPESNEAESSSSDPETSDGVIVPSPNGGVNGHAKKRVSKSARGR